MAKLGEDQAGLAGDEGVSVLAAEAHLQQMVSGATAVLWTVTCPYWQCQGWQSYVGSWLDMALVPHKQQVRLAGHRVSTIVQGALQLRQQYS